MFKYLLIGFLLSFGWQFGDLLFCTIYNFIKRYVRQKIKDNPTLQFAMKGKIHKNKTELKEPIGFKCYKD
jgi:hypothetical protein